MSVPAILSTLRLPVIGAPLFIVSNPGAGHRPVQGRRGRQLPGAQRPPAEPARRVDPRDHRGARRARPRPPRRARRRRSRSTRSSTARTTASKQDVATCEKWKVPLVITSLGARDRTQ